MSHIRDLVLTNEKKKKKISDDLTKIMNINRANLSSNSGRKESKERFIEIDDIFFQKIQEFIVKYICIHIHGVRLRLMHAERRDPLPTVSKVNLSSFSFSKMETNHYLNHYENPCVPPR